MIPTDGARKYDALVPPVLADGTANREVVDSLYVQPRIENSSDPRAGQGAPASANG
jgi:hypothetical protein